MHYVDPSLRLKSQVSTTDPIIRSPPLNRWPLNTGKVTEWTFKLFPKFTIRRSANAQPWHTFLFFCASEGKTIWRETTGILNCKRCNKLPWNFTPLSKAYESIHFPTPLFPTITFCLFFVTLMSEIYWLFFDLVPLEVHLHFYCLFNKLSFG